MGIHLIERLGGSCRAMTLLTIVIHFLHPLFSVTTYLYWGKDQEPLFGRPLVTAYLSMNVVACVFYLFLASVFYMWAWRFPEPEEVAKRRRIYGVIVNLFFSDIPLFVIETKIVWQVKFVNGVQGFTFVLTCVSIFYSAVRVWTFLMVKAIKVRGPTSTSYPRFTLTRPFSRSRRAQYGHEQQQQRQQQVNTSQQPQGEGYYYGDYRDTDGYSPEVRLGATPQQQGTTGASPPYSVEPAANRYYYNDADEATSYSAGTDRYLRPSHGNARYYD